MCHAPCVELLLGKGANVDHTDSVGEGLRDVGASHSFTLILCIRAACPLGDGRRGVGDVQGGEVGGGSVVRERWKEKR